MATELQYHLKIVQTRPNVDTAWYEKTDSYREAWNEFNKYTEESTTINQAGETIIGEVIKLKINHIPIDIISDDGLISTRAWHNLASDIHDDLVAILNDDSSKISEEKKYDEAHEITYLIVSEEISVEIPTEWPVIEPPTP
jgi:hypothetical protein